MPKSKKSSALTLNDLFLNKIKSLLDIEEQLVKALPKMAKAATNRELKGGFTQHLAETKNHVRRLEEIFKQLGKKPARLKVDGIRGIIKDGEWVIKNIKPKEALDANLIAAASYVEHYEIAGYLAAIAWADKLELNDAAQLLEETLNEEMSVDHQLAELADAEILEKAL